MSACGLARLCEERTADEQRRADERVHAQTGQPVFGDRLDRTLAAADRAVLGKRLEVGHRADGGGDEPRQAEE